MTRVGCRPKDHSMMSPAFCTGPDCVNKFMLLSDLNNVSIFVPQKKASG